MYLGDIGGLYSVVFAIFGIIVSVVAKFYYTSSLLSDNYQVQQYAKDPDELYESMVWKDTNKLTSEEDSANSDDGPGKKDDQNIEPERFLKSKSGR